jgi:plasmid stability protein
MKYYIAARSRHRIRVRLHTSRLTDGQAQILQDVFSSVEGVNGVRVYKATAGLALEFDCPEETVIQKLDSFRFENVVMMAEKTTPYISTHEMKERKLDPGLKKKLRMRILAESVLDLAMPTPVQLGYHLWQLITLKDF